jgi:hypothetical protein
MKSPLAGSLACLLVGTIAILSLSCQGGSSREAAVGPSGPGAVKSFRSDGMDVEDDGLVVADNESPVLMLRTQPAAVNGRVWTTGLVTFNLCHSSDPDQNAENPEEGDTLNWQFHFGDSGTPAFNPDGTFNPDFDHFCRTEHTYAEGRYTATVSVTDKHLEDQSHDVSSLARITETVTVISSPEPPPVAGGCYDASVPGYFDQSFNGRLNQVGNAVVWFSDDGTCENRNFIAMWVRTDETTRAGVLGFCNAIGGGFTIVLNLADAGFRVPPDVWACG